MKQVVWSNFVQYIFICFGIFPLSFCYIVFEHSGREEIGLLNALVLILLLIFSILTKIEITLSIKKRKNYWTTEEKNWGLRISVHSLLCLSVLYFSSKWVNNIHVLFLRLRNAFFSFSLFYWAGFICLVLWIFNNGVR